MNPPRRSYSPLAWALGAGVLLSFAGCNNWLAVKQKVTVDAISAPGAPKPTGQSYRLVARKSVMNSQQAQLSVIKACVDAALIREGLYEAPANLPSDLFIEIAYGMDTSSRVDALYRESFLQLSARANLKHTIETTQEEQLWDVRAAINGLGGPLETAMPLLASVACKYLGADTHVETILEVPVDSPEIKAVRESAIKTLSRTSAPATSAAASTSSTAVK